MASIISKESINEILSRADIIDIMSSHVTLKRSGKQWMGLCPFHEEDTPSFSVNNEKNVYYCFGCAASGNVFTFLQKVEGLTFAEAVEQIASRYTIPLKYEQGSTKSDFSKKEKYYKINELCLSLFRKNLFSERGKKCLDYLHKRNLNIDKINDFKLGFAPYRSEEFFKAFNQNHVDVKDAIDLGILSSSKNIRFAGRLIFPIFDNNNNLCGFGSRSLGEEMPKYINSSESDVYKKSYLAYGLNWSKESIRQNDLCIVVEGYFDFITLFAAGITNVVACSGTSLTIGQLRLIKRFTNNVVFLFDSDNAGQKASLRALPLCFEAGMNSYVCNLPTGSDPDDFISQFGTQKLNESINNKQYLLEYFINTKLKDDKSPNFVANLAKELAEIIRKLDNPVEQELVSKQVSKYLHISKESMLELVRNNFHQTIKNTNIQPMPLPKTFPADETLILKLLFSDNNFIDKIKNTNILDKFSTEVYKKLAFKYIDVFNTEQIELSASYFLEYCENPGEKEIFAKIITDLGNIESADKDKILSDCILKLNKKSIDFNCRKISGQIKEAELNKDFGKVKELLILKNKLAKENT
ncbi:MAG: DNA primase [Pseudomonadota bacterium]